MDTVLKGTLKGTRNGAMRLVVNAAEVLMSLQPEKRKGSEMEQTRTVTRRS